ncbi:MAG: twin-arginine translocase TatA/TatE family subunit [Halobacteriaceae archaeon]
MASQALAFVGGIPGGTEMVVILLIAVLLFGANKIPKLARSTGQAMGEFQRGREEIEQELEEMKETASVDTDLDTSVDTGTGGASGASDAGSGSTVDTSDVAPDSSSDESSK